MHDTPQFWATLASLFFSVTLVGSLWLVMHHDITPFGRQWALTRITIPSIGLLLASLYIAFQ